MSCSIFFLTASMVARAFLPQRMTMMPPVTSPSPSSSAIPRRSSGPICRCATSPRRTGTPVALARSGMTRKSSRVLRYPVARTMYSASPSSRPIHLFPGSPRGWLQYGAQRDAIGSQPIRIEHDLVLTHGAAHGGDLGHVGDGLELVLEEPILQRPQLRNVMFARAIDERVFIDPANAGGIGPERRLYSRRQAALNLVQVFEHAGARPIQISAVFKEHVNE